MEKEEKGWKAEFHSYAEAHSFAFWQHTLDDILEYFFPASWVVPTTSSSTSTATSANPSWIIILIMLSGAVIVSKKKSH
jgi:hypothetical protein